MLETCCYGVIVVQHLVHNNTFVKDYEQIEEKNHLEFLINDYGRKYFPKHFMAPESYLLWWSRFENIADWFIKNEIEIRKNLDSTQTEIALKFAFGELKTRY